MKSSPTEQLIEILKIKNIDERIKVACDKFKNSEISAKAIRMFFSILDTNHELQLLNNIYSKENRKSCMERLSPKMFIPRFIEIYYKSDINLYGTILKYYLIEKYDTSKTQKKYDRIKKVIQDFKYNPPAYFTESVYGSAIYSKQIIESFAIKEFFYELMYREKKQNVEPLKLPSAMTIGVELEFVGINKGELSYFASLLRNNYKTSFLNNFTIKNDLSVREIKKYGIHGKDGVEVVSPILDDTEESWEKLRDVCLFFQAIGGRVNKTCGGHIHFGENVLGVDKEAWKVFISVWNEAEPLIYMMSNRRGERTRESAKKYAKMNSNYIGKIDWSYVKLKNEADVRQLAQNIYYDHDRYKALNLNNITSRGKNTIEFRLSNGTINYDILRENILLYGRLLQMAKLHSVDPNRKKKQLEKFFEVDLQEEEKLVRFLDLVFEDEDEKKIFYDRWASKAGEIPVFGEESIKTYIRKKDKKIQKSNSNERRGQIKIDNLHNVCYN